MIIAPLMDPILSLAFGLSVSDGKLIRRSAVPSAGFGGGWHRIVVSLGLGISHAVEDHRPHVSQLDRSWHRHCGGCCRVVLDDPQTIVEFDCRSGDYCALATALCQQHRHHARLRDGGCIWPWNRSGFSRQIAEGSFLLFLANLISITVPAWWYFCCSVTAHSAAVGAIFCFGWACSGC